MFVVAWKVGISSVIKIVTEKKYWLRVNRVVQSRIICAVRYAPNYFICAIQNKLFVCDIGDNL